MQDAIIAVPRIGYNITISINLHAEQITTLNFPLYQVNYNRYQHHKTQSKMKIDTYLFFFFFFFYSLFKVDIRDYVIVISLVTIY